MRRLRSSSVLSLPCELVEEILARVPATSLKRLRSTCKQWNALFNDKRFTKKHLDKAAKQYLVLLWRNNRLFSMSVNLRGLHDSIDPSIEEGELCLTDLYYDSNQFEARVAFHCDGLLLCTTTYNGLVVWNPCTGQTKSIESKSKFYKYFHMYALGYEHKKSCRNYKILWFVDFESFELEMYEFNSNSWRVLHRDTPDFKVHLNKDGVSLKGNTYWIATDKEEEEEESCNDFLISFDFTRERFGPRVCLPSKGFGFWMSLSSVEEERLLLLFQDGVTLTTEIWMTDNITETKAMSWTNFLKIDLIDLKPHVFWNDVTLFIDEKNKVVVCCEDVDNKETNKTIVHIIGKNEWRKVDIGEGFGPRMLSYVPTLVRF